MFNRNNVQSIYIDFLKNKYYDQYTYELNMSFQLNFSQFHSFKSFAYLSSFIERARNES